MQHVENTSNHFTGKQLTDVLLTKEIMEVMFELLLESY